MSSGAVAVEDRLAKRVEEFSTAIEAGSRDHQRQGERAAARNEHSVGGARRTDRPGLGETRPGDRRRACPSDTRGRSRFERKRPRHRRRHGRANEGDRRDAAARVNEISQAFDQLAGGVNDKLGDRLNEMKEAFDGSAQAMQTRVVEISQAFDQIAGGVNERLGDRLHEMREALDGSAQALQTRVIEVNQAFEQIAGGVNERLGDRLNEMRGRALDGSSSGAADARHRGQPGVRPDRRRRQRKVGRPLNEMRGSARRQQPGVADAHHRGQPERSTRSPAASTKGWATGSTR